MNDDDYLWNKRGSDPEIARLEELMGDLGWRGPDTRRLASRKRRMWVPATVAIGLAAALAIFLWVRFHEKQTQKTARAVPTPQTNHETSPSESWQVADQQGAPACGSSRCADGLHVGDWLETDATSRARVAIADIGFLEVEPGTRVRLKKTSVHEHRLELARGTISARVSAPPRLLIVETPTANAVDLGCAYTLTVLADGGSLLQVTSGWVGLEGYSGSSRTAYVSAGSVAETKPGHGVGTPRRADAAPALVTALRTLDFGPTGSADLAAILSSARLEDTISLWHLIWRVSPELRVRIYDRMRALEPVAPPTIVTRDTIAQADEAAMAAWREDLKTYW